MQLVIWRDRITRIISTCCRVCRLPKKGNRDKFHVCKQNQDGLKGTCKKCNCNEVKEYRRKPENIRKRRERDYSDNYGLTINDYEKFLNSQDSKCAICGSENTGKGRFHVDHCHLTNKIRGLLCRHCNLMLGLSNDNVQTLRNAIRYLER